MKSNYNIGDEVRFLDEVGEGTVIKILKKGMVLVETNDGFEYPMQSTELVLIKASPVKEKPIHQKPIIDDEAEENNEIDEPLEDVYLKPDDDVKISLAWIPNNGKDAFEGELDVYLVNDSNYYILFHVLKTDDTGTSMLDAGALQPNLKLELGKFLRDDINQLKSLQVQMILYGHKQQVVLNILDKVFEVKPVKFFNTGNYCENDFFDIPAFFMDVLTALPKSENSLLESSDIKEMLINQEHNDVFEKQHRYKSRKPQELIEVDLHINELKDSVVGMSNSEILDIQMQYFHKSITEAIQNKVYKIVFIHGIGNGTLRDKLRESLNTQYKIKYEDASFKEYGFGATMVLIR